MKRNLNEKSRRKNEERRVRREAFLACMTGYARRSASFFGSGKFFTLHSSFFILLLLSGCRKDLCYTHDEHGWAVKVNVVADWEQEWERAYDHNWQEEWLDEWIYNYEDFRPEVADGIRALVYKATGEYSENNLEATGGRLPMEEGTHSLLFYNNDTEYILFDDIATSASATATTRTVTRASFEALHAEERTVNQPDMLYGCYIDEHVAELTVEPTQVPITLRPLTYTYLIRYEFAYGQKYMALARGALAGMAEKVYLQDGHTGDEAATVMFDCTLQDYGAEAQMQSFGVPNYPGDHYTRADGSPAHYALNLEVRMTNGETKTFEFDVTDQVEGQPRGGVIVVNGLTITDEEGGGGGGGFDVDVDGWGEYEDIEVPLS